MSTPSTEAVLTYTGSTKVARTQGCEGGKRADGDTDRVHGARQWGRDAACALRIQPAFRARAMWSTTECRCTTVFPRSGAHDEGARQADVRLSHPEPRDGVADAPAGAVALFGHGDRDTCVVKGDGARSPARPAPTTTGSPSRLTSRVRRGGPPPGPGVGTRSRRSGARWVTPSGR